MFRFLRWVLLVLLLMAAVLAAGVLLLQRWLDSDDFRQRLAAQAQQALGLPVQLQRVEVALWPAPALVLQGLMVQTRPALRAQRIEVRPRWADLWHGQLAPATLVLHQVHLSQAGVQALQAALRVQASGEATGVPWHWLPRRTVLDGLHWEDARGQVLTLQAEVVLGSDAWPQQLTARIEQGRLQGTRLQLEHLPLAAAEPLARRRWAVRLQVAGGTVQGRLALSPPAAPPAAWLLEGELRTQGVELSQLTAAHPTPQAQARQPLSGRLQGTTRLSARLRGLQDWPQALHTRSDVSVQQAVLHGIDLARAVKTVGVSRGGSTPLDTLAGQVVTRGRALEVNPLVASSGVLSASGQLAVSPQQALSGRLVVALGGAVGVPLALGGTLAEPQVSLTRGAMIGAAIGTVLMPGVGTGAGASLGDRVSEGWKKLTGK